MLGAAWAALPVGALIAGAWSGPACLAAREVTVHDELADQLRRAVFPGLVGRQTPGPALSALRSLRDEKLRPLMADLASGARPGMVSEGILALADMTPEGKLTLGLVGDIHDPEQQALVVLQSLGSRPLETGEIETILSWPNIDARLEGALRCTLASRGGKVDIERATALAGHANRLASALGELLRLLGGDAEATTRLTGSLAKLDESDRSGVTAPLLEAIRRDSLKGAAPLVRALLGAADTDEARADALRTLMQVDPAGGAAAWGEAWTKAEDIGDRVRLCLVALDAGDSTELSVLDTLAQSTDALPAAMGRAGAAVRRTGTDTAGALLALIKHSHAPSTMWALNKCRDLAPGVARQVLLETIAWGGARRDPGDSVPKLVFEAATRLAPRDAAALGEPLAAACAARDNPLCEALLAALLRSGSRPVWESAHPPAFSGRTAQAMSVLYEARVNGMNPGADPGKPGPLSSGGGFPNDPDKAEKLRQIAQGWGGLPDAYRTMAAWLALCQDGKEREALTRMLAPEPR